MLLEALSCDDDRIAQVGRIAREQAHAARVPCYYIDESSDPEGRIIRHDPDGTLDRSLFFAEFFKKFPVLRWRPVRIRLRTPPSFSRT